MGHPLHQPAHRSTSPLLAVLGAAVAAALLAGCGATETVLPIDDPAPTAPQQAPPPATATASTSPTAPPTAPITTAPSNTAPLPADGSRVVGERPPPARPADFPNGGERYLLARLPADMRPRCTREPERSRAEGAVAGIACDLRQRSGVSAYYDLFPTTAAAEAAHGRYRRANGVPLERGSCAPADGRRPPLPAEEAWPGRTDDAPNGRRMCLVRQGAIWLVVTLPEQRIMAFTTGRQYRSVYSHGTATG